MQQPHDKSATQDAAARTTVSSSELRRLLDEMYRETCVRACVLCHVPLPYYWEPSDDLSENWRIGAPWKCARGCHTVIEQAARKLALLYDVRPPILP